MYHKLKTQTLNYQSESILFTELVVSQNNFLKEYMN